MVMSNKWGNDDDAIVGKQELLSKRQTTRLRPQQVKQPDHLAWI